MGKKLTKEKFIAKARSVHGDKYDYSKVEYVNNKTKVCIICPKHGEFWQTPSAHLQGQGCKKCGYQIVADKLKIKQTDFIKKSQEKHPTYDYSKVEYVDCDTKVCIICPKHGEFWQTPDNHLRGRKGLGQECPQCAKEQKGENTRLSNKDFITRSIIIHGNKYDYSKVEYVNCNTKVCIICPEHGEFWQKPDLHLQGCGCQRCNESKGERKIKEFLLQHQIKHEYQKTFEWLKDKRNMFLDFYLPWYNLGIEYQGELHYTTRNDKNKERSLNKLARTQYLDKKKKELCNKHEIQIEYINFDEDIETRMWEIVSKIKNEK